MRAKSSFLMDRSTLLTWKEDKCAGWFLVQVRRALITGPILPGLWRAIGNSALIDADIIAPELVDKINRKKSVYL
jgi:hypothetical protein